MSKLGQSDQDEVLLDYLGTLLQDDSEPVQVSSAEKKVDKSNEQSLVEPIAELIYPLAGIRVSMAGYTLLLPIKQLAGMQAISGPLSPADDLEAWPSWKVNPHADLNLLDASPVLTSTAPNYADAQWRGHILKLKAQDWGLLVDEIMGPYTVQQKQIADMHLLPANIPLLVLS